MSSATLTPVFPDGASLRVRRVLAALTALLWWAAGAFGCFPLGWLALVPFFLLISGLERRERWRWGYFTGFISFWLINWWLVPTITRGAAVIGASAFVGLLLSLLAVTIIAAVHGLQPALVALLWKDVKLWKPLLPGLPFVVAGAWALLDWVRCQGQLAHSWGALAYSQTADLPLINAVNPQHILTGLCVLTAASVALYWRTRRFRVLAVPLTLMVAAHVVGFVLLQPSQMIAPDFRVMLVQTDVSSLGKSGAEGGETPFAEAYRLTIEGLKRAKAAGEKVDLVVWPETTMETSRSDQKYLGLDMAVWQLQGPPVTLLTGAGVSDRQGRRTNEALLIPKTGPVQQYAKQRLVPFGERAPYVRYLPFLQLLAPRPQLEPGAETTLLKMPGEGPWLVPLICFESCFPRDLKLPEYERCLMTVLTNDEWFGGTEAPYQHRCMAVLRAVESHTPLIQCANGGYSVVIDAQGRVLQSTQFGKPEVLDVNLPNMYPNASPYYITR